MQTFTAVVHKEDDLYVAECPEIGTASQGESIEKAIANLQEATELYLGECNSLVPTFFNQKYVVKNQVELLKRAF